MRPSTFQTCAHRAALTFTATLIGWSFVLAPAPRPSLPHAAAPAESASIEQYSARTSATKPAASTRGSDVVFEDYPLRDVDLAALRRGERLELPHPDGGTIDLRVERVEFTGEQRHLMLMHDGLVSTFTESRGAFFGTLATSRGVYALEGDGQRSRLTRHTLLDQRMNPNAFDYRSLPSD